MKKKALIIGFVLLLLITIPASVFLVQRQQQLRIKAAPSTTLSFTPPAQSVNVGDTFSLSIMMDTGENSVATAQVRVTFDPAKLTATEIKPGSFMPHALSQTTPDNTAGTAFIVVDTLGADSSPDSIPMTKKSIGAVPVAVITFKAKADTAGAATSVGFGQDTKAIGETSGALEDTSLILSSALSKTARITVTGAVATPTPTTVLTPTPTAGLTATPTPTTGPKLTVTPVATVPVTGDIAPTSMFAIGGMVVTMLGVLLFFAL